MLYFSEIYNVIDENVPLYAHTKKGKENELLIEHIKRCDKYYKKINEDKSIKDIVYRCADNLSFIEDDNERELVYQLFYQMIMFHDIGKLNPSFQAKILNKTIDKDNELYAYIQSEHSCLSSLIYIIYFFEKLEKSRKKSYFKKLIVDFAFIISRHHSNLTSFDTYWALVKEKIDCIDFLKDINGLKTDLFISKDLEKIKNSITRVDSIMKKVKPNDRKECISKYFLLRLAYSVLVSCDYYATTKYMDDIEKIDFGTLGDINLFYDEYKNSDVYKSINKYKIEKYSNTNISDISVMNDIRSHIFLEADSELEKSKDCGNIFFLESPTGSGKSNTALNLSFKLMENRKKLFYVYPFNTLVEQNKQTLYKLFKNEEIREQIKVVNSITPIGKIEKEEFEDYKETLDYYKNVLLDRQFLNYPFVITTHVSLFSTLFGYRKENLFSFLQLSNSVIVLDEIQSYKNSIWAEIIILLKECAEIMNIKIIIMSATLPRLEFLSNDSTGVVYLLNNSKEYFENPLFKNRVRLSYELMNFEDKEFLLSNIKEHIKDNCKDKKILVEFIKKQTAIDFYQDIYGDDDINVPMFLITGDDSIVEREKILKPIRSGEIKDCILISTQVIEAGVDIDMDIGYKDISMLDSEEQFLGRINRSCSQDKQGVCYFFNYDNAKSIYKNDYRVNDEFTLCNPDIQDILKDKNFAKYYQKIMSVIKNNRNDSTGDIGLKNFFENVMTILDYPKVSEKMKLIEDDNMRIDIVLCREIEDENGKILNGWDIWCQYKDLLNDKNMDYAEKQVKLSQVRSQLNNFIYTVSNKLSVDVDDIIGELYCIEDGEYYFENGKFIRSRLDNSNSLFI